MINPGLLSCNHFNIIWLTGLSQALKLAMEFNREQYLNL